MYASWWYSLSLRASSSLRLEKARFLAASFAPGAMWCNRERRQRDWAVMIDTESLLRRWWRMRPCSESDTGRPSIKEMWEALDMASFLRSSWKSWETSPYWPATKHLISPNPCRCCSRGPTCPASVPWYLVSILLALVLYSFGIRLARWSTAFCPDWYQVAPALIHLSSARLLLVGPCSAGKVIWKSGTRPWRSLVYWRSPPSAVAVAGIWALKRP